MKNLATGLETEIETMSSTQLAEMLNKEKKEVNRLIREMFPTEIAGGDFPLTESTGLNAGKVDAYHLPETQSIMFVAKHDITYLKKIAEYWKNRHEPMPQLSAMQMIAQIAIHTDKVDKELNDVKKIGEATKSGLVTLENKVNAINKNIVDKANTEVKPSLGYASITTCQNHFAGVFQKAHTKGITTDKITSPHIKIEQCTNYVPELNTMRSYPAYCLADIERVINGLIKSSSPVNKVNGEFSTKVKSPHYAQSFKHPM